MGLARDVIGLALGGRDMRKRAGAAMEIRPRTDSDDVELFGDLKLTARRR